MTKGGAGVQAANLKADPSRRVGLAAEARSHRDRGSLRGRSMGRSARGYRERRRRGWPGGIDLENAYKL